MLHEGSQRLDYFKSPLGINSVKQPKQLLQDEYVSLTNLMYSISGDMIFSRPGTTKFSNSAIADSEVSYIEWVLIDDTYRLIAVGNNGGTYTVYYYDGSDDPISCGEVEGFATIIPFDAYAMVCDGSYLKYIDADLAVRMCYDIGSGSSGSQFDNITGSIDVVTKIGNNANTRLAYKFTSQTWTAGWTIPTREFSVYLSKLGTPQAVPVTFKLRLAADSSILASKDIIADATDLETSATLYTISISDDDITTEMSPVVAYYASVEHEDGGSGDTDNCVQVHSTTVASGGLAYYYSGGWVNESTKNPIMVLRPGKPPKASSGVVKSKRLFLIGDPDNPGKLWYSNQSVFDFCTADAAGNIGIIDNDANSFPAETIISLFGAIHLLGSEDHQFLAILQGTTPATFAIPQRDFPHVYSNRTGMVNALNDALFVNKNGVFALMGVEQTGDYRLATRSAPVFDKFVDYWTDGTFVEYFPQTQQFFVKFAGYTNVLVAHTSLMPHPDGRFPWTEYNFNEFTPTSFRFAKDTFYIGADDGHIYKLDESVYTDDGEEIDIIIRSSIVEPIFSEIQVQGVQIILTVGTDTGTFVLRFKKQVNLAEMELESGFELEEDLEWGAQDYFGVSFNASEIPYYKELIYDTQWFQWELRDVSGCGRVYISSNHVSVRPILFAGDVSL